MVMAGKVLKRIFMFDDKELVDPGQLLTVEEVRKYYSTKYPELTNASFTQSIDDKKDSLIIKFGKSYGTKG
jgi:PRTRC genetic system protein C